MRFLLDMCLSIRVGEWLRDQRHDVVHLREQGLQRLPNGEIFAKAGVERRILLTCDLDFSEIVALSGEAEVSVVVLRLRNTRTRHVIDRLGAILPVSAEALGNGAIVVVEETRHRVRKLPIGDS